MANPNIINVTSILAGNAGFNLSATATATLITVASDKLLKINNIICANVDGTKTVSVPADSTLVILDTPIYLMEGDILKGGASAASDLDLFVSYEVMDDA